MADRPLTPKQAAFAEGIADGKNPHQAALAAGYAPGGSAASVSSRLIQDERLRDALKVAAMKAGLTADRIGQKLHALSEAQRFELSRDGSPVHLGPDNRAQLQAMDIVIKMLGGYPNPRLDVTTGNQQVVVIHASRDPLAALDPFAPTVIEGEAVDLTGFHNPDGDIPIEDDFLIQ